MKLVSDIQKESSKRIFWVIQTIFGFIIGRSFYSFASIFIPPFNNDIITLSIALISVYICILWSWIDFSYTLIVAPYQFRGNILEKYRFLSDLFIVLLYSYLLVDLDHIKINTNSNIIEFFLTFAIIYLGYIISGILRRIQYGKRASRLIIIIIFFILFTFLAILYLYVIDSFSGKKILINRMFMSITIFLTISYRIVRSKISKRKYTIGIDIDGVLANQIVGILPVIEKEHGIKLNYNDVTSWNLQISNISIDKIIVNSQQQRNYVINMPLHNNAKEVMINLIKKYYIAIATARSSNTDLWTQEWLNINKISYDSYHNLKECGKHNANEEFDILIDDYIGNIKAYLENNEGKAILFSQPWNQDRSDVNEYIQNKRLIIVKNWNEIENAINKIL